MILKQIFTIQKIELCWTFVKFSLISHKKV